MASFKYKPHRLKYINNIDTLECKHYQYLQEFKNRRDKKEQIKKKIEIYVIQLNNTGKTNVDGALKVKLRNDINRLQKEYDDINNCVDELEYFSKTHDTIFDYYDIIDKHNDKNNINKKLNHDEQLLDEKTNKTNDDMSLSVSICDDESITSEIYDRSNNKQNNDDVNKLEMLNKLSQNKRKIKKTAKKRLRNNEITNNNKSIIDYFINSDNDKQNNDVELDNKINISNHEKNKNEIKIEPIENIKKNDYENNTNRASLLTEYLDLLDFSRADNKIRISNIKICPKCKKDKIIIYSDGIYVCTKCGDIEQILVNSDLSNYKDCLQEKPAYPYKRLNHFCEWLSQFQAKESTDIPDSIYEKIYDELKKNSITKNNKITPKKMKEILKKLRLHQYYEHIPHIISRITGKPPPTISRETEEKLKIMFRDIQAPFAKHCPPERINFLSYSYVLHKFCQLLELDEFIKCFPLLKSREKLRLQDRLWKDICRELRWQFYPSI